MEIPWLRKLVLLFLSCMFVGCASVPVDSKKHDIMQCVKEMRAVDDNIKDVFEVCRQIHGLKKVKDPR